MNNKISYGLELNQLEQITSTKDFRNMVDQEIQVSYEFNAPARKKTYLHQITSFQNNAKVSVEKDSIEFTR